MTSPSEKPAALSSSRIAGGGDKALNCVSPAARQLYQEALEAVERQDWDAAIAAFTELLAVEPAFHAGREAWRAVQLQRADAAGFFSRAVAGIRTGLWLAKAELGVHFNAFTAVQAAERVLNHAPRSVAAHYVLAKAALAADLPHAALLSLEFLHRRSPRRHSVVILLARALVRVGQTDRAAAIYAGLLKTHPNDPKVRCSLQKLGAHPGPEKDARERSPEPCAVPTDEEVNKQIKTFEAFLPHGPKNLRILKKLGELYARKLDFDRALLHYQAAFAIEGRGDGGLERVIAETALRQSDHAMAQHAAVSGEEPS